MDVGGLLYSSRHISGRSKADHIGLFKCTNVTILTIYYNFHGNEVTC